LKLEDLSWVVAGSELPRKIKFETFCILHSIVNFNLLRNFVILSHISFLILHHRSALIYWDIEQVLVLLRPRLFKILEEEKNLKTPNLMCSWKFVLKIFLTIGGLKYFCEFKQIICPYFFFNLKKQPLGKGSLK